MVEINVNLLAVLVSTIIGMALGFFWYSPALFGNQWMKLMKFDPKKVKAAKAKGMKGMGKTMVAAFLATFVMSYVLAHFVVLAGTTTIAGGLQAGFWIWLGFVATIMLNSVLWESRPLQLYYINIAHYLVALLVMGAILAVWQ